MPYRAVPGPIDGTGGFCAKGPATAELRGPLVAPLQNQGGLSFWFRTDAAYRSGTAATVRKEPLVEIADTLVVSLIAEKSSVTLMVQWGGNAAEMFERHVRIILPELPGPAWHHLAVHWNGPAGVINAFLDGTPYYVPGGQLPALATRPGRELVLHLSALALADVHVASRPFTDGQLRALVGPAYWGKLDDALGARDLGQLGRVPRGRILYARPLDRPADVADWRLEGPGIVSFRDGGMEMKSQRPDGPQGHIVHWCPQDFPDRFVAEWEFELMAEHGLCILFFAAKGQGGLDLFDPRLKPRQGVFEQYINGDIDAYHISYFANTPNEPRRTANLRKDSGFFLIANGPVGVPHPRLGQIHQAVLIKDGPRLRMAVDGTIIISYTDAGDRAGPALTDGKIGFRQMQWTSARYRNFRVSELGARE